MANFLSKDTLSAARGKFVYREVELKNGDEVLGVARLRSLTGKEYIDADAYVYTLKKDHPLVKVGSFYFMLAIMLVNEDGSQMFASYEEGCAYLLELNEGILSQLLPQVRALNVVEPQLVNNKEESAAKLEAKVEQVAKNFETVPAASGSDLQKSSEE